jgi:hypothetical protein
MTRGFAILQEESVKLQEKYTSDLGRITVDADQEVPSESMCLKLSSKFNERIRGPAIGVWQAHGLRKEKRHMQEEINRLAGSNQDIANELRRLKLSYKDLTVEKMEHEIEIERLQFQLR